MKMIVFWDTTLMMEAVSTSETSVGYCDSTRRSSHTQRRQNLKYHLATMIHQSSPSKKNNFRLNFFSFFEILTEYYYWCFENVCHYITFKS
jgi:hypothetical protein